MSQNTSQKNHLAMVREPGTAGGGTPAGNVQRVDMRYLVRALIKYNASDLHLKVGRPPLYRINGKLIPAKMDELGQEQLEQIIYGVLSAKQRVELEEKRQIDLSFHMKELGRFRCHVFFQRGGISAAVRIIPMTIPTIDELGLPPVVKELCQRPRGLLLVTGATGSGKSTSMAAMIQYINENNHVHVLTIEDPIEYVYRDLKASITQREVGSDTHSLKEGLYAGLRQDPDVIMIGELRDCDMIQLALSAAETGHLVISTLHTKDAAGSIDRILEVFPSNAQNQVRIQLASVLVGVVSQQLLVRADGSGRVPACEIMVKSPAIENYILKSEVQKIPEAIGNSNNYYKMQTMNQALERLVNAGAITAEEAIKSTSNPDDLRLRLSGLTREQGYEMAGSFHSKESSQS
ncbi:MAG: type IV pilus twitching motility protein PilT [Oligoflexia bacterium]|nr:type IV pilus twitching motility protein PilT [Oligoflexia bacterium]